MKGYACFLTTLNLLIFKYKLQYLYVIRYFSFVFIIYLKLRNYSYLASPKNIIWEYFNPQTICWTLVSRGHSLNQKIYLYVLSFISQHEDSSALFHVSTMLNRKHGGATWAGMNAGGHMSEINEFTEQFIKHNILHLFLCIRIKWVLLKYTQFYITCSEDPVCCFRCATRGWRLTSHKPV